jgi:hypothetical protein
MASPHLLIYHHFLPHPKQLSAPDELAGVKKGSPQGLPCN